jgi:hypothetical protein
MAAEQEEIVFDADILTLQDLAPDLRELEFERIARGRRVRGFSLPMGSKRHPIRLAARRARNAVRKHQTGWHRV